MHSPEMRTAPDESAQGMFELGMQARARTDYARAEALLREAVARAESASPPEAQVLAASLNALGLLCKDLARYDEGRAWYERALALLGEMPDASPHDVATIYHNLAGMAHARGDYVGAEPIARTGLAIRLGAAEPRLHEAAADMIALGAILEGLGKYDEAAAQCREALAIMASLPGDGPSELAAEFAVALNNLGAQYARLGKYSQATDLMERALAVKRRLLEPGHPDIAVTVHNIATVWVRRGESARAETLFAEAYDTFLRVLGPTHPKTKRSLQALDRCRGISEAAAPSATIGE